MTGSEAVKIVVVGYDDAVIRFGPMPDSFVTGWNRQTRALNVEAAGEISFQFFEQPKRKIGVEEEVHLVKMDAHICNAKELIEIG